MRHDGAGDRDPVNRLENIADKIAREAIASSSRKKKTLSPDQAQGTLEVLETATDKAEDAANVLETVLLNERLILPMEKSYSRVSGAKS